MSGIKNNRYEFMGRLYFGMIREGYVEKVSIQQALTNGLELDEEERGEHLRHEKHVKSAEEEGAFHR